jgi:hypothetical protein
VRKTQLFVTFALAGVGATACRSIPTQIELIVDTDAPSERQIELRVLSVRGIASPAQLAELAESRALVDRVLLRSSTVDVPVGQRLTLPGSVTLLPASSGSTEPVTVWLRARIAATATAPEILLDRVLYLSFIRGAHGYARAFLPVRCGDRATDCTSVAAPLCTVSTRCREQGATCGDLGECITPSVVVSSLPEGGVVNDASAVEVDATVMRTDAGTDRDASSASDGGDPLVVTNSEVAGPGSLNAAIDSANANCATRPAPTIRFDIPLTDRGLMTRGTARWWRLPPPARSITCAQTTLDGTTQTTLHGNTNAMVFGSRAVGNAGVMLAAIEAPEIELRGSLGVAAADCRVRAVAVRTLTFSMSPRSTAEQCMIGAEPDSLTAYPANERSQQNIVLLVQTSNNVTVRSCVVISQVGMRNEYNTVHVIENSADFLLTDSYLAGVGGGNLWDEIHLNPALNSRVIHNFIGGTGWEKHIEWVAGSGGTISQNTFSAGPIAVSPGASAMQSGNVTE